MSCQSSLIAQWVDAIGSFVAALVALFVVIYFEIWKAKRDRPKLTIEYDNADPQCHRLAAQGPVGGKPSYFIRLKIVNTGNAPAKECVGRLAAIANEDGTFRSDWDISSLIWTAQETPQPKYLSAKGDYSFLDVVWTVQGERIFRIRTDSTPRAIKLEYEPGQYYFQIKVYAEKAEPIEQWFRVNWYGEFDKLVMEKTYKPGK
jgi:hypothetical protein